MIPGQARMTMRYPSKPRRLRLARAAFAVAVLLASAVPALAADYKIGVLHVERILQQSAAAKSAHDRIEREFKPRDDAITKKEEALRTAQAQLEKQGPGLSADERASRERNLDLQSREIERLRQQFNEDLRARQFEELDRLKGELDKVLTSYAKAQNYDLILQDALWVGKSVDITDDVIKALNADASGAGSSASTSPAASGSAPATPPPATSNPGR